MNRFHQLAALVVIALICLAHATDAIAAEASQSAVTNSISEPGPEALQPKSTIWQSGVGQGFLPTVQTFSAEAGVAIGVKMFGGKEDHDLALLSLSYGHMLGQVKGEGHWYRGNFEGRLELFGGGQYYPTSDAIIGLTPHLRYDFATGTRWIPFFDLGAGVTATSIGPPDLSGTFEFNLQATTGIHWFTCDDLALTGEVRYLHVSSGGIHSPNLGMNDVMFTIGLTWLF